MKALLKVSIFLLLTSACLVSKDTNLVVSEDTNLEKNNYFLTLGVGISKANVDTDLASDVTLHHNALNDAASLIDIGIGFRNSAHTFFTLGYQQVALDIASIDHIYATVNYQFIDTVLNPYVGLVAGYGTLIWDEEPAVSRYNKNLTEKTTTFGLQVGVEEHVSQNMALFAKYQMLSSDFTLEIYNNTSNIQHTQFNNISVGVKYDF